MNKIEKIWHERSEAPLSLIGEKFGYDVWKKAEEETSKDLKESIYDFRVYLTGLKELDVELYENILNKYKELFGDDLLFPKN